MVNFLTVTTGAAAPTQITGADIKFSVATFFACKSFTNGVPNYNTSGVNLGHKANELPIYIHTSGFHTISLTENRQKDSLSNFYFQGANADGLYVLAY